MAKSKNDFLNHKNNLMHVRGYDSKKTGKLISIELIYSGTDPKTKQYKNYPKTFRLPPELIDASKKEILEFSMKCQMEWKEEAEKLRTGMLMPKQKLIFCDFAEEEIKSKFRAKWLEEQGGASHYVSNMSYLKIFRKHFGLMTIDEVNQQHVIQNFCKWLCERTYRREATKVIQSLKDVLDAHPLTFKKIASECGIAHTTLALTLVKGNTVKKETADKLCKFLEISFKKYFEYAYEDVLYSKSCNRDVKNLIYYVLNQARMTYPKAYPVNYASKEFIKPVTGTVGEKDLFDDEDEIVEFVKKVDEETDPRRRIAFNLFMELGLRGGECAGLEFDDFKFKRKEVRIQRSTRYQGGVNPEGKKFGVITKKPKSKKGERTLPLSDSIIEKVQEYREWWMQQKLIGDGEIWERTNRLFVQNDGKPMSGSTIASWLKDLMRRAKEFKKNITPHALRYAYISLLITNGEDPRTVMEMAGHANIETTLKIYARSNMKVKHKAVDGLSNMLRPKAEPDEPISTEKAKMMILEQMQKFGLSLADL